MGNRIKHPRGMPRIETDLRIRGTGGRKIDIPQIVSSASHKYLLTTAGANLPELPTSIQLAGKDVTGYVQVVEDGAAEYREKRGPISVGIFKRLADFFGDFIGRKKRPRPIDVFKVDEALHKKASLSDIRKLMRAAVILGAGLPGGGTAPAGKGGKSETRKTSDAVEAMTREYGPDDTVPTIAELVRTSEDVTDLLKLGKHNREVWNIIPGLDIKLIKADHINELKKANKEGKLYDHYLHRLAKDRPELFIHVNGEIIENGEVADVQREAARVQKLFSSEDACTSIAAMTYYVELIMTGKLPQHEIKAAFEVMQSVVFTKQWSSYDFRSIYEKWKRETGFPNREYLNALAQAKGKKITIDGRVLEGKEKEEFLEDLRWFEDNYGKLLFTEMPIGILRQAVEKGKPMPPWVLMSTRDFATGFYQFIDGPAMETKFPFIFFPFEESLYKAKLSSLVMKFGLYTAAAGGGCHVNPTTIEIYVDIPKILRFMRTSPEVFNEGANYVEIKEGQVSKFRDFLERSGAEIRILMLDDTDNPRIPYLISKGEVAAYYFSEPDSNLYKKGGNSDAMREAQSDKWAEEAVKDLRKNSGGGSSPGKKTGKKAGGPVENRPDRIPEGARNFLGMGPDGTKYAHSGGNPINAVKKSGARIVAGIKKYFQSDNTSGESDPYKPTIVVMDDYDPEYSWLARSKKLMGELSKSGVKVVGIPFSERDLRPKPSNAQYDEPYPVQLANYARTLGMEVVPMHMDGSSRKMDVLRTALSYIDATGKFDVRDLEKSINITREWIRRWQFSANLRHRVPGLRQSLEELMDAKRIISRINGDLNKFGALWHDYLEGGVYNDMFKIARKRRPDVILAWPGAGRRLAKLIDGSRLEDRKTVADPKSTVDLIRNATDTNPQKAEKVNRYLVEAMEDVIQIEDRRRLGHVNKLLFEIAGSDPRVITYAIRGLAEQYPEMSMLLDPFRHIYALRISSSDAVIKLDHILKDHLSPRIDRSGGSNLPPSRPKE